MIDDDGYDGIRSHGVDPDWNPFSTPRDDDPDDIGWDDGSETPHANPSRMSGKGVARPHRMHARHRGRGHRHGHHGITVERAPRPARLGMFGRGGVHEPES